MHNSDLKVSKIRQISMSEIDKSQKNDLQQKKIMAVQITQKSHSEADE